MFPHYVRVTSLLSLCTVSLLLALLVVEGGSWVLRTETT